MVLRGMSPGAPATTRTLSPGTNLSCSAGPSKYSLVGEIKVAPVVKELTIDGSPLMRLTTTKPYLTVYPSPFSNRFSRSEEHTSELQSLMRISYAVFCLKKKNTKK